MFTIAATSSASLGHLFLLLRYPIRIAILISFGCGQGRSAHGYQFTLTRSAAGVYFESPLRGSILSAYPPESKRELPFPRELSSRCGRLMDTPNWLIRYPCAHADSFHYFGREDLYFVGNRSGAANRASVHCVISVCTFFPVCFFKPRSYLWGVLLEGAFKPLRKCIRDCSRSYLSSTCFL